MEELFSKMKGMFSNFGSGDNSGLKTIPGMGGNFGQSPASGGGMFSNFSMNDAVNLGKLGLMGMQYKDSKDMMKYQKGVSEENRQMNREDREYNKRMRDENRKLRF